MKYLILILTIMVFNAEAKINIWPSIPFNIEGANLCAYRSAYSQTRSEYMQEMVSYAERLLYMGDYNPAQTLSDFNRMYERNLAYAKLGLGVTLEYTFKAYIEDYYRQLTPRTRQIDFKYTTQLNNIVNSALRNNQLPNISQAQTDKIGAFAYGTYSLSPNCNGNILVTLTLIQKDGNTKTYIGNGPVQTVMSQIASKIFEDFQRTTFPSTLRIGTREITLIGGLNGHIDSVQYLEEAENICKTLGARLPTGQEYKFINSYGSWSGGITLGRKVWALDYPNVFIPYFERMPVRNFTQVNERTYYYTCIK